MVVSSIWHEMLPLPGLARVNHVSWYLLMLYLRGLKSFQSIWPKQCNHPCSNHYVNLLRQMWTLTWIPYIYLYDKIAGLSRFFYIHHQSWLVRVFFFISLLGVTGRI